MSDQLESGPIVVGIDETGSSDAALAWAVDEARRQGRQLTLMHATRPVYGVPAYPFSRPSAVFGWVPERAVQAPAPEDDHVLAKAARWVRSQACEVDYEVATRVENPAAMLIDASRTAACVVVGGRSRGRVTSALLGSTSMDVAAHAACPAVVVRGQHERGDADDESQPVQVKYGPVVVGSDGSDVSESALAEGFRQAEARGVPLVALHAWSLDFDGTGFAVLSSERDRRDAEEHERTVADRVVAAWSEKYPHVPVESRVVNGHPVQMLVDASGDAGLLVVGERGRGGFHDLVLGSVAQGVLHHADCPVMVVRSTETSRT